ncbi:MAG: hypothetical protein WAM39_11480 [Bryobacteraceae bacterium]
MLYIIPAPPASEALNSAEFLPQKLVHHGGIGPEFERYGEEFDSATGTGGFEVWIPIKK